MTMRRGITAFSLAGSAVLPVVVIVLALVLAVAAPAVAGGKGGGKSGSSDSSSKGGGSGSSGKTSSQAPSGGSKSSGSSASGSGGGGAKSGGWQSTRPSAPRPSGGGRASSGAKAGGWAAPHVGGGGSAKPNGPSFSLPRSVGPSGGSSSGWRPAPATRGGPPSAADYRRPSFTPPRPAASGGQKGSSPPVFRGGSTAGKPSGSWQGGWQPTPDSKPDTAGPRWRPGGNDAAPAPGGSPKPWSGSPRGDKSPTPPRTPSGWSHGGGQADPGPGNQVKPWPGAGTLKPGNPGGDKAPRPPGYQGPGGQHAKPFPGAYDSRPPKSWRPPTTGRVSFRARGDGRPAHPYNWYPRYHHYYYRSMPRYYIYGGWGSGWYDPWWWGNYWWPTTTYTTEVHHYYHYDYDDTVRNAPYYEGASWMDAELTTTLTDVAVAWTTGDIELLQAHLTPSLPVAIRHDWEQDDPWVLAPPVLLDVLVEALDSQTGSRFHFAQIEQMEPGLVWAVAEHSFQLRDEDRRRDATMEFMFRRHDNIWLVEAIVASPESYWWADAALLDDAARESVRLLEEMDQAGVSGSG